MSVSAALRCPHWSVELQQRLFRVLNICPVIVAVILKVEHKHLKGCRDLLLALTRERRFREEF